EHDLGAQAFPASTKMIRSTDQEKDIAEFGLELAKVFATRSPLHAELLKGADFRKADITFEKDYDVDLGGVKARAMPDGAHPPPRRHRNRERWRPRVVLRRHRHEGAAGVREPIFKPAAVVREPRRPGGAQTGADRAEPRPEWRRDRLHHRLSRLSDRG